MKRIGFIKRDVGVVKSWGKKVGVRKRTGRKEKECERERDLRKKAL